MKCPNCGKQIANDSSFCEWCGIRISKECTVTILGHTENVPAISFVYILKDGVQVGVIAQNGKVEVNVEQECELTFKYGFRSTKCRVSPGDWILLSFNRSWGNFNTIITDKNNYPTAIEHAQEKDKKRRKFVIIYSIIMIVIFAIIGVLGSLDIAI